MLAGTAAGDDAGARPGAHCFFARRTGRNDRPAARSRARPSTCVSTCSCWPRATSATTGSRPTSGTRRNRVTTRKRIIHWACSWTVSRRRNPGPAPAARRGQRAGARTCGRPIAAGEADGADLQRSDRFDADCTSSIPARDSVCGAPGGIVTSGCDCGDRDAWPCNRPLNVWKARMPTSQIARRRRGINGRRSAQRGARSPEEVTNRDPLRCARFYWRTDGSIENPGLVCLSPRPGRLAGRQVSGGSAGAHRMGAVGRRRWPLPHAVLASRPEPRSGGCGRREAGRYTSCRARVAVLTCWRLPISHWV